MIRPPPLSKLFPHTTLFRSYSNAAIRSALVQTGVVSGYVQSLDPVMGVIQLSNVQYFPDAGG